MIDPRPDRGPLCLWDIECVCVSYHIPIPQLYHPGATATLARDTRGDRRDIDVIREHHRYLEYFLMAGDRMERREMKETTGRTKLTRRGKPR